MSRWFRHYAGMMRDEKLVRAALRSKQPIERVVWVWGAMLESAAEINDGGRFDFDAEEAAYFLRVDVTECNAVVTALVEIGRVTGTKIANWEKRQYKSDDSSDRVKRHREKKTKVNQGTSTHDCNDDETLRNAPETETETETETVKVSSLRSAPDASFAEFKKVYPKRDGSNPWKPAYDVFKRAVGRGVSVDLLLGSARGYAMECNRKNITGTDKVAQALTWLRQERYLDYAPLADIDPAKKVEQEVFMASKGYEPTPEGGWRKVANNQGTMQ